MSKPDDPTPRLSRREVLTWGAKAAGVLALGGVLRLLAPPKKIRRPPGALPEEQFLALCTRCGKCLEACPSYITHVLITESIVAAGTPKLARSCPSCRRCNSYCPTGALGG